MAKKNNFEYWPYLSIVLIVAVVAGVVLYTNSGKSAAGVSDDLAGEAYAAKTCTPNGEILWMAEGDVLPIKDAFGKTVNIRLESVTLNSDNKVVSCGFNLGSGKTVWVDMNTHEQAYNRFFYVIDGKYVPNSIEGKPYSVCKVAIIA